MAVTMVTITLDAGPFGSSTTPDGIQYTVAPDRMVRVPGVGVFPFPAQPLVSMDGVPPTITVPANDDPGLAIESQGYGIKIIGETSPGGVPAAWMVTVTTASAPNVNLSDLSIATPIPPGFVDSAQLVSQVTAAETSAANSAASAAASAASAAAGGARITPGKNLFDLAAATQNAYWNNQASGQPYPVSGWVASAKIPVTVGTTYTVTKCRHCEAFDSTGAPTTALAYHDDSSFGVYTFTVPAGVASVGIDTITAYENLMQLEVGSSSTSYQPYGTIVQNLLSNGALLDPQISALTAATNTQTQRNGVTVYRSGTKMLVRSQWNSTLDICIPVDLAWTDGGFTTGSSSVGLANSPSFLQVGYCNQNTLDGNLWPAPASGVFTPIQGAGDDNCPINVGWSYVGANHGWDGGSQVTMTGHGKTTADLGSTYSDGSRTYTLLKIIGANTLLFGNPYTVASGIVTGGTTVPAATLTHVSGGTNTANVTITGGVSLQEIHPAIFGNVTTVTLDGRPVIDGLISQGADLAITETFQIVSYKALIDWAQANVGTDPLANISSMLVMAQVSNTYHLTAGGVVTVGQTVTRVGEDFTLNMGVTQAMQINVPSGGSVQQYMPGIGTAGSYNFSTYATVTSPASQTNIALAQQLVTTDPATRMTQWAYTSGAAKAYGMMLGLLPVMDGKHATRRTNGTDGRSWFMSATLGKNYPQLCWGKAMVGAGTSISGVGFRKYLPPDAPIEQVVPWGGRNWVFIDTPAANTTPQIARVPTVSGRSLATVGTSTVTAVKTFVSPEGVTYTNTAPGYLMAEAVVDTSV